MMKIIKILKSNRLKNMNASYEKSQQGIVLIVALIALVILMLASVALIRSTDTNLLIAGNLAFKRDLVNNGDVAISTIRQIFSTGTMSSGTTRQSDVTAQNYFSHIQASNTIGIPTILLDKTIFDATYSGRNINYATSQVTIRYVVDRMCIQRSPAVAVDPLNADACSILAGSIKIGGSDFNPEPPSNPRGIYRISMRISGPRNTEAFMQSTFAI